MPTQGLTGAGHPVPPQPRASDWLGFREAGLPLQTLAPSAPALLLPARDPHRIPGYGSPLATKPSVIAHAKNDRARSNTAGALAVLCGQTPELERAASPRASCTEEMSHSASVAWPEAAHSHGGTVSLAVRHIKTRFIFTQCSQRGAI